MQTLRRMSLIAIALALASPLAAQTPSCTTTRTTAKAVVTCTFAAPAPIHDTVIKTVTVHDTVRVVSPPAIAPGPALTPTPGAGEPVYAANQTLLFRDDFDGYADLSGAVAGGWQCTDGSTTQDVTTSAAGACQIIPGGYDGTGKAMRLAYNGISNGAGNEAHAWGRPMLDAVAATPGHAFYITYYFRITPGAGYTLDELSPALHVVQVKWIELWRTDHADRAQFSASSSYCTNDVPMAGHSGAGTMWNFFPQAAQVSRCQSGQVRPPFAYQGAGQWHRITHKYMTQSAPGARDGVAQMWYDGTLILSVAQGYCGVAVPGRPATSTQNWCETADLDGFFTNETVSRITLGSVMTSYSLWPFTIDYDHMTIWRDP